MSSDFILEYPLIYTLTCVMFWYFVHRIISFNVSYKPENFWIILSIWSIGSGLSAGILLFNGIINNYICGFISMGQCILVAQCYDGTWQNKMVSGLFAWSSASIFEGFTMHLLIALYQTDINTFADNHVAFMLSQTVSKVVPLFLVSVYPYYFKSKDNSRNFLNFYHGITFLSIPFMTVLLLIYLHSSHIENNTQDTNNLIVNSFTLLCINVVFFWLFDVFSVSMKKHYEHKMLELQVEYYEKLYHNVGEERMAISTLRHNIKNDLISLQSSLKSGDIPEVQQQLDQLLEDESLENQRNSIIPIVDAVLSYKIPQAEKMGVRLLHHQVLTPQLELSNSHLANILGNLLDNAMEYTSTLPEKEQRTVDLQMKKSGQNLTITVSNPFLGELLLHEDLPLSSKREGATHGIGLVTVRNLVKELGGHFSVVVENQVFTAKVVIYQCFP